MSKNKKTTDVAVIGGGPGGYAAAFRAADLGMDVTLIDNEENPGGVCLYRGCIPSKALLHVARLIQEADHAADWGVRFAKPTIQLTKLRRWKEGVVDKMTGGLGQLVKHRGLNYIKGRARLADNHKLVIQANDGSGRKLTAGHIILATGSQPTRIPGLSIESPRVLDSTSALDLPKIPKSLLVIGGGYIGLEMGSVYASLGTNVTVVEMTAGLLPGVDRDLVGILEKRLRGSFRNILLNTKVTSLKEATEGIHVTLEGKEIDRRRQKFDSVLIAVGRRPNSEGLGLENTNVDIDKSGIITTDEQQCTGEPNIFAIGDVAGEPMLAHKGSHEGMVAAEVIAGKKVAFEPHAIPAVVFTDPEIAWCGLTETEAARDGRSIQISKFPWGASGRATCIDRPDGVTKLIFDPDSTRLLGMGMCGAGAGELIAEGVLAVEMAALATDIKLSIHPHPTLSETIMESAELFFGASTHIYRPRKKGK